MPVTRVFAASATADEALIGRAASAVLAAADYLEMSIPELLPTTVSLYLDTLRRLLERRLAERVENAGESDEAAMHLVAILRVQCELLDSHLSWRVRSLSEIRNALGGLRGLSPREMIKAAPVVLSRELAFERTMISTVRGSLWLPQLLFIAGGVAEGESRRFLEFISGAQFQLASAPLETEVVRKRCGALVPSPASDRRTFKAIVEVSGCFGYVAAPIIVQGRAIGMLHADRPGQRGAVRTDHLDQLEAFAECLSVAFESAVLEEKAVQQRVEVGNLGATVDSPVHSTGDTFDLVRQRSYTIGDHHTRQQADISSLTTREREIMEHVATGATNGQIARYLVISEGTVKSHLKHIAKKLNTPSRAAAVAVFSGLAGAGATR
jgi:DNA-binding CsgD family transcriptional regulator/GAF domain-containing protein